MAKDQQQVVSALVARVLRRFCGYAACMRCYEFLKFSTVVT